MLMSIGMISSVPYADENDVSPVGTRLVVRRPRVPGEFLGPFALCSIQVFAQAVENGAIADLGMTIALRIVGSGESVDDLIFRAEVGHLLLAIFVPLSEIMVWGSPKQHTMFCQRT